MKANETELQPLLEGTKQYVVPLFQRAYRWKQRDWDTLWQDLMDLYNDVKGREHFIGAIVTMPVDMSPHGINKYMLIDGQQRLTTIFLLLTLIRDEAKDKDGKLAAQINELYLLNKWEEGPNRYKLLPTQSDRGSFCTLVDGKALLEDGNIQGAMKYFERKLRNQRDDAGAVLDLNRLKTLLLQRIVVVSIVLHQDENPYLIFESLNGKGQPLTQADLVRNYVFMRIGDMGEQEVAYKDLWLPMESRLGDQLTPFLWRYLNKDGVFVRQNTVYEEIKNRLARLDGKGIIDEIISLHTYSEYYQRMVAPKSEPNREIRRRMDRLNRWEITTAYPFLLNLYDDLDHGRVTAEAFCAVLDMIESFVVRRFFSRMPTNALNRIFIGLYKSITVEELYASTQAQLVARGWPTDEEFLDWWERYPLYTSGKAKTRHVLESLEQTMLDNHEPVDVTSSRITIEHVMPQTLNEDWEVALGVEAATVHATYLHTIGNLTLTGMNEPMGNSAFGKKRPVLAKSNFALNRSFAEQAEWTDKDIRARAAKLGQAALSIWRRPDGGNDIVSLDDPTGRKPVKYWLFGNEYPVKKYWREVLIGVCEILVKLHGVNEFADMAGTVVGTSRQYVSRSEEGMFNPTPLAGTDLFVETNLGSKEILRIVRAILVACGHGEHEFEAYWV